MCPIRCSLCVSDLVEACGHLRRVAIQRNAIFVPEDADGGKSVNVSPKLPHFIQLSQLCVRESGDQRDKGAL